MTTEQLAGRWIPLGRVGGLRFFLHPLFFVAVAALALLPVLGEGEVTWRGPLTWLVVLLGSLLWHELGHALAARRLGLHVGGIYLHLLPFAYVDRGAPRDELCVALAGPGASLLAAGVLAAVGAPLVTEGPSAWEAAPLGFALLVNLLMGLVNLLPALPLDGGRVLSAALRLRGSDDIARRITRVVGLAVAAAIVAASFVVADPFASAALRVLGIGLLVSGLVWRRVLPTTSP